jgi:hypothetical protein
MTLPGGCPFVIDRQGIVRAGEADPDYTRRVQRLELAARLRRACAALGGDYSGASLGLLILALLYTGARRLEHLQYLAGDPLVTRFCGLAQVPTPITADR